MRTTRRATAATITVLFLATGCGQSYDDTVKECRRVLIERPASETGKPGACKDIKQEDYAPIAVSATIERLGWADENGRFSKEKMLKDSGK
ncbi:hypothetical protein ACFWTC_03295 [Streptomyces sp. NPDC058619]|uniref:hypothetical protein n=1 Tax=unclassified Streptomyces TaxID=2593676 RepID=UPI00366255C5